ncbi:NAD(FAD)-utilizing dehydrogenase [Rubrivivax sp. A210]|uniref:TIGR03862 family flavoprotein n=1 Tax=Rubrivivax sp. A210 TaxID=2772301 RepID=UPI00191B3A92|nr:TIGR03862 family flavoprotein [Rubrivivax sp. A210]CAD5374795.1 NAD(FAD)-utilizing dehydrogenase [Rubrivivax sp. A210]
MSDVDWAGRVAVIGGGPAGLMAAEALAAAGCAVDVFDAMPSVGRKFLLAGKGGLNLTHAEPFEDFLGRYGERAERLRPLLQAFGPEQLRAWAAGLGVETFVGSSRRVFPVDMKAAPLLRAWLHRLRTQGVRFHMRQRWTGWDEAGALRFESPAGSARVQPAATVLALGGASWPRLGSDGAWWPWLAARGVALEPLAPSNCGFDVGWSEHLSQRFAGEPLKSVAIAFEGWRQRGEFIVTAGGVEGSLVYAVSSLLRDRLAAGGDAVFELDLLPDRPLAWVQQELAHTRGPRSLATHLKTRLHLSGLKAALLWEIVPREAQADPARFAALIKALPIRVKAPRPIAEAISTAGGVPFEAMDEHLMLSALPGVFCAGEMLDWEAPTGGYLLTACFASGRQAGQGAAAWVGR